MNDYHVLLLAMSVLPKAIVPTDRATHKPTGRPMRKSKYQLKGAGGFVGNTFEGLGQLEPVPLLIKDHDYDITHVVILTTEETERPIDCYRGDPRETFACLSEIYKEELSFEGLETISHVEFFKRRLQHEGIVLAEENYSEFCVDIDNPEQGLEKAQQRVRDLFSECLRAGGDWKLWLDVHGGFREMSMALFGIMQMLAAPDEQDLVRYVQGNAPVASMLKRLSDGKDTVPIERVYSIEYNPTTASRGEIQAIHDRTDFYRTFTKPAIVAYMNYGQYAQMALRSVVELGDEHIDPYAFISYRHGEATSDRLAFLGRLKEGAYRYWYDDAIRLQDNWMETLREAIHKSSVFIGLITKTYYASYQCVKELRQAIDEGKLILLVSLDGANVYRKGGVIACDPDDSAQTAEITAEEMAELSSKQQLILGNLIDLTDEFGAFGEEHFKDLLSGLANKSELFGSIRAEQQSPSRQ